MDQLIAYLMQFGELTAQDIAEIASHVKQIDLRKGDYFVESGKICVNLGFILAGICRSCYYSKGGDDFTRYFIYEGRIIGDINSYLAQVPALEYIEAVTDCSLLTWSKAGFDQLEKSVANWTVIFAKLNAQVLENKLKMASNMLVQDGYTRYLNFLNHYPGLCNRVPQAMLASYLGLTPSSLSRIRRKIN